MFRLILLTALALGGCSDSATDAETPAADAGTDTRDTGTDDVAPQPEATPGAELLERLTGLWSGPATNTPLGSFPVMAMDVRPIDDGVVYSQVDVDGDNNLFFAFAVETHPGEGLDGGDDILVFRNGGSFQSANRESWTALREHGEDRWRFCSLERGCEYIEAVFELDGDDLVLEVTVKREQHLTWRPERVEERSATALDDPPTTIGTGPELPALPNLDVEVTWREPLEEPAEVWVVLSTTKCGVTGRGCTASRSRRTIAQAGATSVSFQVEKLHPGEYFANCVLDRNRNFTQLLFPDDADRVSLPDKAVTVGDEGATVRLSASIAVP